MTPIPVFKDIGQIQPAFSDKFHDSLRRHMIASAPPAKRRKQRIPIVSAPAAERRAQLTPDVMRMKESGMTIVAIMQALGLSKNYVKRIIREAAA